MKWDVVADQFPLDELAMTHEEIAERLPDGSLLLPLDEVIPQIPPAVADAPTPPVDVHQIEEFPEPFQPHAPAQPDAGAKGSRGPRRPCRASRRSRRLLADAAEHVDEAEMVDSDVVAADQSVQPELEDSEPERPTYQAGRARTAGAGAAIPSPPGAIRRDASRRCSTPLLNGLEIGQRDGAGTTVVTVIAPTLSEDSVVRTAIADRAVPQRCRACRSR